MKKFYSNNIDSSTLYPEIYQEISNVTNNFTLDLGEFKCADRTEANIAMSILSEFYMNVELEELEPETDYEAFYSIKFSNEFEEDFEYIEDKNPAGTPIGTVNMGFGESFNLRESDDINSMMELMNYNNQFKDDPYVGSFWYDPKKDELFGIYSVLASDAELYNSKLFKQRCKTGRKLHKDIWRKEQYKARDKRFQGDHTLTPRGRVFQLEDGSFKVMVGDWFDKYPQVKAEIIFEFQLPENTEFVKDYHWNIGHGFNDEFLGEEWIKESIKELNQKQAIEIINNIAQDERHDPEQFKKLLDNKHKWFGEFNNNKCEALASIRENDLGLGDAYINEIQSFNKGAGKNLINQLINKYNKLWLMSDPNSGETLRNYYRQFGFNEFILDKNIYNKPVSFFYSKNLDKDKFEKLVYNYYSGEAYMDESLLLEKIVKKSDGYYVQSEKGKNLGGPYKTKEKAEERLKQVEKFKHMNEIYDKGTFKNNTTKNENYDDMMDTSKYNHVDLDEEYDRPVKFEVPDYSLLVEVDNGDINEVYKLAKDLDIEEPYIDTISEDDYKLFEIAWKEMPSDDSFCYDYGNYSGVWEQWGYRDRDDDLKIIKKNPHITYVEMNYFEEAPLAIELVPDDLAEDYSEKPYEVTSSDLDFLGEFETKEEAIKFARSLNQPVDVVYHWKHPYDEYSDTFEQLVWSNYDNMADEFEELDSYFDVDHATEWSERYPESLEENVYDSYGVLKLKNILAGIRSGIDLDKVTIQSTPRGNYEISVDGKELVIVSERALGGERGLEDLRDDGFFVFDEDESLTEAAPDFWDWIVEQGMDPYDVEENPDIEEHYRKEYNRLFGESLEEALTNGEQWLLDILQLFNHDYNLDKASIKRNRSGKGWNIYYDNRLLTGVSEKALGGEKGIEDLRLNNYIREYDTQVDEALGQDYSNLPEVSVDYTSSTNNNMPGITSVKGLVKVLDKLANEVGPEFKVRTTHFGHNISWGDLRDDMRDIRELGWHIERDWDTSMSGFNEVYICTKDVNESLEEAKNDTLNKDLWDENNELKPEVREKLEYIVDKFKHNLEEDGVKLDISDVEIIGSNANYNYTDKSDIDLHIIANLGIYKDKEDLAQIIYNAYRKIFNDKFEPMIYGHEVELYVEPDEDLNRDEIPDAVE